MKITENDRLAFKELTKKHNLKESILSYIFKKVLSNNLSKDVDLSKAIKDADAQLDKTKKWIDDQEKQGNKIPDYLKKMVGK